MAAGVESSINADGAVKEYVMATFLCCKTTLTILIIFGMTCVGAHAQQFETVVFFNGLDGASPSYVSLAQGLDGDLYGTTYSGGAHAFGTVFRVNETGVLTTLYNFCSETACADGANPYAGVILGTDGKFYGATSAYGGTIFRMTAGGTLTTLATFCAQSGCPNGRYPFGALLQASDGNFYGTTYNAGASNYGTVFKMTMAGALAALYNFSGNDGANPQAGLIQGNDGSLYGTTSAGGASNGGTVFRITLTGKLTTVYSFCSKTDCTDGTVPDAALIQASDGNFYGTTSAGGANSGGTVFKVTPAGALTTLHSFNGNDGNAPVAGLVQGTDGNFYGTTSDGGPGNGGTVFEMTSAGTLTTLHNFSVNGDLGAYPEGSIVQATSGSFVGTTTGGGDKNSGSIFGVSTGIGPFVSFLHNPAKTGQGFGILGHGLTGTTNVLLNGTSASFTVKSNTFVEATVPAGATSGYVTVSTPSGTLTSNVPFHVIQ